MCEVRYAKGPLVKVRVRETRSVAGGETLTFDRDELLRPHDPWWECLRPDGSWERVPRLAPFFGIRVMAGEVLRRVPVAEREEL